MKCTSETCNKKIYAIIGIFFLSIVARFLLANFYPKTINCYPDELLYLSFGESLWNNHALLVSNMPSVFDKAAYPILIAPSFIFFGREGTRNDDCLDQLPSNVSWHFPGVWVG